MGGDTDIGIWPLADIRVELVVVDPDTRRVADGDAVVVFDEADAQVLDDDVGAVEDVDATASDMRRRADADQGLIGADLEARGEHHLAHDVDDLGCISGHSRLESRRAAHCHCFTSFSAGRETDGVLFGEPFNSP